MSFATLLAATHDRTLAAPDFDDDVRLARLLDAIDTSSGAGRGVSIKE